LAAPVTQAAAEKGNRAILWMHAGNTQQAPATGLTAVARLWWMDHRCLAAAQQLPPHLGQHVADFVE
jgi:hypothetical protein